MSDNFTKPIISAIIQRTIKKSQNPNSNGVSNNKKEQQTGVFEVPNSFQKLEQCEYNSFLVHLKDEHSRMQNQIVLDLKKMSQDSKKTISQIDTIQKELEKYQQDIDSCIKKLNEMQSFVSKFQGIRNNFKIKSQNIGKLRDTLNPDKTKVKRR